MNVPACALSATIVMVLSMTFIAFWVKPDYYRPNPSWSSYHDDTKDCSNYSYKNVDHWSQLPCPRGTVNQCGSTGSGGGSGGGDSHIQSPIDIQRSLCSCSSDRCYAQNAAVMKIIRDSGTMDYYDNIRVCSLQYLTSKLVANVSLKTTYKFTNDQCDKPMISVHDEEWTLFELHFHTGGSEHTFDGIRFESELHLVHKKSDNNKKDAFLVIAIPLLSTNSNNAARRASQSYYFDDNHYDNRQKIRQLAEDDNGEEVGTYDNNNMYLEPLLIHYETISSNIINACQQTSSMKLRERIQSSDFVDSSYINHVNVSLNLEDYDYYYDDMPIFDVWSPYKLIPSNSGAYIYRGSFTTPPCAESVRWYVIDTPLQVSVNQIKRLNQVVFSNVTPKWPSCDFEKRGDDRPHGTYRPVQSRSSKVVDHACTFLSS